MGWDDQPEFEEIEETPRASLQGIDPQAQYGCRCDICPLAKHHRSAVTWAPVPPDLRTVEGPLGRLTAISEFPASAEVIHRRPLFGEAGSVFTQAFIDRYGMMRRHITITNLVLCRYPSDDPTRFMAELKRQWKTDVRIAEKTQQVPPPEPVNPIDACRPQLMMVLRDTDRVLLLGAAASQNVIGTTKALDNIRGGFYDLVYTPDGTQRLTEINQSLLENPNAHKIQAVPAYSPALPLRDPVATRVFWRDMERAYRWWTGTLDWTDVTLLSAKPGPDELRKFFERPGPFTFDIETTRHGPRLSVLRTIGITDTQTHEGYVIPFESIDGKVGFFEGERYYGYRARIEPDGRYTEGQYPKKVAAEIFQILRDWMLSKKVLCGHNALLFDMSILELYFGLLHDEAYLKDPDPIYILDGLALSRCEQSERRRNLYLQGTLACDVPDWKGGGEDDDEIRVAPRTYEQLAVYNLRDCKVTSLTLQSLWPRVVERKQQNVAEFDRKAARVAREMTHLGIRVDQTARMAMEKLYTEKLLASREKIAKLVGNSRFNPGSAVQLGELLYGRDGFKLPILKLTATGAASTDDDTLRDLMPHTAPGSTERELLAAIRFDRSLSKTLGTGILPLRMWNDLRENSTGQMVGGLCDIDGRVHPQYPIFNPATGRFASKDPNCFDAATEILTEQGWIPFPEYRELWQTVKAAQWEYQDKAFKLSFALPTQWHEGTTSELVQVETQAADLAMTRKHRVFLVDTKKGNGRWITADQLSGTARTVWAMPHAGQWPGGPGLPGWTPDMIRLLVAIQADGTITKHNAVALTFAKERKVTRMRELLTRLNIPYTTPNVGYGTMFYCSAQHMMPYITLLGGPTKLFGPWIYSLDREQLTAFVEEVWLWDGVASEKSQYASKHHSNASWVQIACVLSGVRANIRKYTNAQGHSVYMVDTRWKVTNTLTGRMRVVDQVFDGPVPVYCVSMPGGTVVVRRNGKVSLSGQSQNYESEVRKVFIPEDGHAFLMADFDQIELRLFAAMAKVKGYLDVFKLNGDPHAITAILIYQDAFLRELIAGFSPEQRERYERLNVPEKIAGSKKYNDLRTFAKTFVYCVIYGGTADTVYLSVSSATDENGKLMFPDMTRKEVDAAFKSFMRNAPEIPGFWQTLEDYGRAFHCVVEPIYGRRRDYLEFDRNGILNHPIQCVIGDTRVTTEHGLVPIRDLVGTRFKAWTGTVWAEATAIQKDVVPTYQVTTLGLSLTVDATHSFLVDTSEGYEWVHTTDLQEHRVALDMARPLEFGYDRTRETDAFWWGYAAILWLNQGYIASLPEEIWRSTLSIRRKFIRGALRHNGWAFLDEVSAKARQDLCLLARSVGMVERTEPYTGLYDHATTQVTPTGRSEAVYTLYVFHEEHRYVANGVISKNSGAAAIATTGLLNLRKVFVPNFREKLGIVNQMHDAFTIEVREDEARDLAKEMNKCINQRFDHIGDVDFSAEVDIMTCWRGKKDDFHPLDPKYKPPKPKEA